MTATGQTLRRATLRHLASAGLGLAACCAGMEGRAAPAATAEPVSTPEPVTLRRMVAACTVSMANNVCRVAKTSSSPDPIRRSQPAVFVVGAGALDRTAYAYLQDGGKTMCSRARAACSADWSGTVCTTARSLWSD